MTRYFFDTWDGPKFIHDDEGLVFGSREAMRYAAIETLPQMAADALPDGETRDFGIEVRDETGAPVFRATLSFRSEWMKSESDPA
jgi:hypothetical protein